VSHDYPNKEGFACLDALLGEVEGSTSNDIRSQFCPDIYEVDAAYLALVDRCKALQDELKGLSDAHHAALNSRSWRWTQPLRMTMRLVRSVRLPRRTRTSRRPPSDQSEEGHLVT
jgi:hypothetical protein